MPNYRLRHPDTEIIGQMLIDFEAAANSEEFVPILEKHGLGDVKPDQWYPAQRWLDALTEVTERGFLNLVSIGIQQINNVEWPPEFYDMTFEELFGAINAVYQQYYRGTDVGGFGFERVSDTHFKVILRLFEPDDLLYGNVYQIIRTFSKGEDHFTVAYDEQTQRRDDGGDNTILHVRFS